MGSIINSIPFIPQCSAHTHTHTLCTQMIQWAICPFIPLSFVLQKTDWMRAFFFYTAPPPTIHLRRPKQSNCICGARGWISLFLFSSWHSKVSFASTGAKKSLQNLSISYGSIEPWVQSLVSLRSTRVDFFLMFLTWKGEDFYSSCLACFPFQCAWQFEMEIKRVGNKSALSSGCRQICIFLQSASQGVVNFVVLFFQQSSKQTNQTRSEQKEYIFDNVFTCINSF
jgi:hypothetical protein